MEPRIDVITLAVGDLDRSLVFYRDGLGLETTGVTGTQFVDDEAHAAGAVVMSISEAASSSPCIRAASSPRTQTFPSDHRRPASSASDTSSRTELTWVRCSPGPIEQAPPSPGGPTIARGGSTPATSTTPTDTSGRSSGTRTAETPRHDVTAPTLRARPAGR